MSSASLVFDLIAKDHASDKFDKIGHSSSSAGAKLKTFAKAGALAAGAAVVGLGVALVGMAKSAMEDQKAQALLAQQLKNSAGATDAQVAATEKWITRSGTMFGIADDDLRPALAKLVAVTHDVGKAQDLAALAMDVSAGTGKSLSTVSAALAKAQLGQVSGLSKLGVATKNADGSTKSLNEITGQLAATYVGQAATAANTTEGKFGRLKLMFDETKESIGSKLLPVLTSMATWFLSKGLPAIQKFGGWLSDNFGPIIGEIVGWVKDKLLPALMSAYEKYLPALKSAFESVKKSLHSMQPAFDLLGNILVDVLIPAIGWAARTLLPLLGKAFELVGKAVGALGTVGTWLWNSVFQPVFHFIAVGVSALLDLFGDLLGALGHVPGFGWAKDAAASLHDAADATQLLADNIKKIPKTVHINVIQTVTTKGDVTYNSAGGHTPYLNTGMGP
jgi:hypothetical protein